MLMAIMRRIAIGDRPVSHGNNGIALFVRRVARPFARAQNRLEPTHAVAPGYRFNVLSRHRAFSEEERKRTRVKYTLK